MLCNKHGNSSHLNRIEEVDQDFYLTAVLIIELVRYRGELFVRSEDEERKLLIK